MREGIRRAGRVAGVVALVFAAGVLLGQRGAAEGVRDWEGIMRGLGSRDFDARELAQKQLGTVGRGELLALKKLAERAADPEVKARLMVRVEALEDEMAGDPLPISLTVANATLPEVRAALARATGVPIGLPPGSYGKRDLEGRYTLDVREKPFWEVFLALSAQNSLEVSSEADFSMYRSDTQEADSITRGIVRGETRGGFFVWARYASRHSAIALIEGGRSEPERLTLQYIVANDPRVSIIGSKAPRALRAVDDLGNELIAARAGEEPRVMPYREGKTYGVYQEVTLQQPVPHGRVIKSLTGEVDFSIGSGEVREEVKDLGQVNGKQTFKIGEEEAVLDLVSVKDGAHGTLSFRIGEAKKKSASGEFLLRRPVTARVMDATGKELWASEIRQGQNVALKDLAITAPVKLVLTVAAREKEVTIGFEFKDLPLPY